MIRREFVRDILYRALLLGFACTLTLSSSLGQSPRAAPSFDCNKAKAPDEQTICANAELAELDTVAAAGYQFLRSHLGKSAANAIALPLVRSRQRCGNDKACIKQSQIAAINAFGAHGAPVNVPTQTGPRANSVAPQRALENESSTVCSGTLAEIRQFSRAAVALTNQDLFSNIPVGQISKAKALERFSGHMRDLVKADPRYSQGYADNARKIIEGSLSSNGASKFILCFPEAWDLANGAEKVQKDVEQREKLQKDLEQQRQAAKIEAARPANRLKEAYSAYLVTKKCYENRLGYQLVFINEFEMDRARLAVTATETSILKEDTSIDAKATWQEAIESLRSTPVYVERHSCQRYYIKLLNQAPTTNPVKDFGEASK